MNPLESLTRKVSGVDTVFILATDYYVSIDTTKGVSKIVLPSKDALSSSLKSGNSFMTLGSFTIYDVAGKLNTNPIQIFAPDENTPINGMSHIWLTVPFAKVSINFDGSSYSATFFGNNELDFDVSKHKMTTITKSNPIVLISNPDPQQYLKIDYAALGISNGSDGTYNGTALKFGYYSNGRIIDITEDVTVSNNSEKIMANKANTKSDLMAFNITSTPSSGSIYEARAEFISNTLYPSSIMGASLVAWIDTPPTSGNSINGKIKIIWKWYQPLKIKIIF